MAAPIWSTKVEFDAATRTNVVSNRGVLRFGTNGSDMTDPANYTTFIGTTREFIDNAIMHVPTTGVDSFHRRNSSSATNGTWRSRCILHGSFGNGSVFCRESGVQNDLYFAYASVNGAALVLQKRVATVVTLLASTAFAYADGNVILVRISASGTSLNGYDDTNSLSVSATDSAVAGPGNTGLYLANTSYCTDLRQDATALTGSASLPTSTTYVDLTTAVALNVAMWDETLNGGNVTVDVYGSDNGTSDAAGASATGLTDPNGSAFSAGSHRYWRVVVNFTRDNTTQEPTVGRIALAAATNERGAHQSGFAGAGMRVA